MRNRTGWRYAAAGLSIAGIAAWVSYNDGLFVARLAGNHDHQAYAYPLLPDGLIVVCLLALAEAARAKVGRSRWAQGGLVLGIVLTTAMNVGAGYAHSVLDAVIDGMVPVVFFIAVEVVLWHVRRAREDVAGEPSLRGDPTGSPATTLPPEFTDNRTAAEVAYRRSVSGGNPFRPYTLATRYEIPRPVAAEIVERVNAELPPGADAPPTVAPGGAVPPAGVTPAHTLGPAPAGALNGRSRD